MKGFDAYEQVQLAVASRLKKLTSRTGTEMTAKESVATTSQLESSGLRFEHRDGLWALLLVPLLVAFFMWSWRKRRQLIALFVQSRLLAHLTVGVSARRLKFRLGLVLVAVALLSIVLARPQWGFHWEEARQRGLDVIVAIDTSRSMLAQDVAPNRLARAKLAALDLKKLARTDRVGLVAFAGGAFLQCPLAFDDEAFRQNVNSLDVSIIPQGGTAIGEAIATARAAFKEKNDNHKVLVLFTDGEDHDGQALELAKDAGKEGMRIFTVGVGTANGELLRISDGKGRSDYVRDEQGNVVKSRLNEKLLQEVAQAANGFYMLLAGANTMDLLYERGLAPLPKGELSARHTRRYHERYQWFLGAAILALLVEMFLPERRRVRRSDAAAVATTNAELRKAVATIMVTTLPMWAGASPGDALKHYQAGRYDAAQRRYEALVKDRPNDPRARFNAGTAAFQARNHEKAIEHFNSALLTDDLALQQRTYYNRGNAQFRFGEETADPKAKMSEWESAIGSFESALKLNPQDADAKHNLDLVKQKLEELRKQQQQEQDPDKKNEEKKDQEQKKQENQQQQNQSSDKQEQQQQEKQSQQQQNKPEQKQQENQNKPQEQQDSQGQKPEDKKADQQSGQSQPSNKDDQKEPQQGGKAMRAMQMTPQQAQQLLDAQKSDERAMIFLPQMRTNRQDRVFKDW